MENTVNLVKESTLAEKIKLVHAAQNPTKVEKTAKPRKGDIVAFLGEDGEIEQTTTVYSKPGPTYVKLTNRGPSGGWFLYPLNKLTKVGKNEWTA